MRVLLCMALLVATALPCVSCRAIPAVRGGIRKLTKGNAEPAAQMPPLPKSGWDLVFPGMDLQKKPGESGDSLASTSPGTVVDTAPEGEPAAGSLPDGVGTEISAEGGMFDFSTVAQGSGAAGGKVAWKKSATEVLESARESGKPVFMYFSNNLIGMSNLVDTSLINNPGFAPLVQESCELLKLNYGEEDVRKSQYYIALRKRMSIKGFPTLIIVLPDGSEILRLKSFKPDNTTGYLGKIKDALSRKDKMITDRRAKLEKEGYRWWSASGGKKVFARLSKLDANQATFTREWGGEFQTFTSRLSEEDRLWIAEQQRKAAKPIAG